MNCMAIFVLWRSRIGREQDHRLDQGDYVTIQNPYKPTAVLSAVDASVNQTSDAVDVLGLPNIGLQFSWTGTPTGTIAILVSTTNDITTGQSLTLTGLTPSFTQPAGSAGSQRIDLEGINTAFLWVTYTAGSGTGTLSATVVAYR